MVSWYSSIKSKSPTLPLQSLSLSFQPSSLSAVLPSSQFDSLTLNTAKLLDEIESFQELDGPELIDEAADLNTTVYDLLQQKYILKR